MIIKPEKKSYFLFFKKRKILSKLFLLVVFVLTLFFFNKIGDFLKNYLYWISSPFQKTTWTLSQNFYKSLSALLRLKELEKENESLKKENQVLLNQYIYLKNLSNSEKEYQEALNFYHEKKFKLLPVQPIGATKEGGLLIDKGISDGLEQDMPIVNKEGVLFGKIKKVYRNFSEILLISDKMTTIDVKIMRVPKDEEDKEENIKNPPIYGILRGRGDAMALLDLIPTDKSIFENDLVVTASLDKIFPKDLLIGKIKKIYKNEQSPYQQADVELFLDISEENLFVITNYKRE